MAKKKTAVTAETYEAVAASMMACTWAIFNDLEESGVLNKWAVDKKVKQAERQRRKTEKRLREERIIDECVAEYRRAKKSA